MIDVRIIAYLSPVAEQPQASLTPVIRVQNVADEDATITGLIRIYRDSTGTMIYASRLVPTNLMHGATADIAALTPFDPPEPADNDYFVKADAVATSFLPGPPISISLGAWHFDIKTPAMGDAPAGHHATHELGGSDPVHVEDLPTTELDDTLVLKPDGAGGVHFEASPAGVTDHGALTGLADDDHPQYHLRHEIFYENDAWGYSNYFWFPWSAAAISAGSAVYGSGTALHPAWTRLSSSVNANSGVYLMLNASSILLAGGERSQCWHRPQTLSGITVHRGFHDSTSASDPVDGAWIWQDPATGIIYGRTRSNSVGSITGTGFQLVTATWYLEVVVLNADASRVDFYLYDEAGALLWTDSLTTNIPTATGRELAHGVCATNSGTTAVALDDIDYLSVLIPNRRPNA